MPGRVVRDAIHGYVELPDDLIRVVDSPRFQRLRRIRQTSLTFTVYPERPGTALSIH